MIAIINNKKIRTLLIFLLTVFFISTVFCTPQRPEIIIYKGEKYQLLYNLPMAEYFKKYPDKHPKKDFYFSTGLTRGYVSTFEIIENQLYIKDIMIIIYDPREKIVEKSVMNEVFPKQRLVKIDWVTGLLVLPKGKKIADPPNYAEYPLYENYIILEIEKGILVCEKEFTYAEYEVFKEAQFEAFKKTEEYEKLKAKLTRRNSTEESINSLIRYSIIEYSTKILVE